MLSREDFYMIKQMRQQGGCYRRLFQITTQVARRVQPWFFPFCELLPVLSQKFPRPPICAADLATCSIFRVCLHDVKGKARSYNR